MRRYAWAWFLAFLLTGCSALPLSLDLTQSLGDFRQGTRSIDLGGAQVQTLDVRVASDPILVDPPEAPVRTVRGSIRGEYAIQTAPAQTGQAMVEIYVSDDPRTVFSSDNLAGTLYLDVGAPATVEAPLTLSEAAVRGLNRGQIYAGFRVWVQLSGFVERATVSWRITGFSLGVTIF